MIERYIIENGKLYLVLGNTKKYIGCLPLSDESSGGATIKNQNKTITENGTYTADSGYTGLGTVTVNVESSGGGAVSGDGWVSGVQYDLNLVKNSYADAKGVITAFNGWDRTDYLPCHGVAALVHTPFIQNQYYAFYDANFSPISTKPVVSENVVLSVPESAFYYVYSNTAEKMADVAIIPLAFKEAEA